MLFVSVSSVVVAWRGTADGHSKLFHLKLFLFDTILLPPVLDFLVDIQDIKGKHLRTEILAAPALHSVVSHHSSMSPYKLLLY